jgi:hypothetical protein
MNTIVFIILFIIMLLSVRMPTEKCGGKDLLIWLGFYVIVYLVKEVYAIFVFCL